MAVATLFCCCCLQSMQQQQKQQKKKKKKGGSLMHTSTFPAPQRKTASHFLWQEFFTALNKQIDGFDATGLNQQMFSCKR